MNIRVGSRANEPRSTALLLQKRARLALHSYFRSYFKQNYKLFVAANIRDRTRSISSVRGRSGNRSRMLWRMLGVDR